MKRYLLNDPMLTDYSKDHKGSKSFGEQMRMNYDFDSGISKPLVTATDTSHSDSNWNEFPINESSHLNNQGKCRKIKKTTRKNSASNLGNLPSTQNDLQKGNSNSWLVDGGSISSNVDIRVVPGSSGFRLNVDRSNVCVKNSQSKSDKIKKNSRSKPPLDKNLFGDNLNPPEQESLKESSASSGSKNPLLTNDVQMAKLETHNGKKYVTKDRILPSKDNKRSKSFNEQSRINYDLVREIKEIETASVYSNSAANSNKFAINKATHLKKQGVRDSLKKTTKKYKASKFDILQNTQHDNPPEEISNSKLSKGKSIASNVDSFAVPGPSGLAKNKNTSNISAKKLQSKFLLEDPSEEATDKSKLTCKICKREISDHIFEIEGRCLFKCCACNYRNGNKGNLHLHLKYTCCQSIELLACNICDELIWKNERHGNEQTCGYCGRKFLCMTLLEKHALEHEGFYEDHCRICGNKISEHINHRGKNLYECCKCGYKCGEGKLKEHLYIHTGLRLFKCDFCDQRYPQKYRVGTHWLAHIICEICEEKFSKIKKLDEHYLQKHRT